MAVYKQIPDSDIDSESPITESLLTQLRDNPAAIAQGASGAPRIVNSAIHPSAGISTSKLASDNGITQGMIANRAIGIGELKTALSIQSASVSGSSYSSITPTGGSYSFQCFPYGDIVPQFGGSSSFSLYNPSRNSRTGYLRSTYIQGSPPYNLGDGEIPLFIYALIENVSGDIKCMSVAPDPHWAYHGPTNIAGKMIDVGGKLKNVAKMQQWQADGIDLATELRASEKRRSTMLERLKNDKYIIVDVDTNWKNKDMDIVPHPWVGIDIKECVACLIDPVCSLTEDLYHYHMAQSKQPDQNDDITKLFSEKRIKIDNTPLKRKKPKGIEVYSAKWV